MSDNFLSSKDVIDHIDAALVDMKDRLEVIERRAWFFQFSHGTELNESLIAKAKRRVNSDLYIAHGVVMEAVEESGAVEPALNSFQSVWREADSALSYLEGQI